MKQIQSSLSFILFGINYVDALNLDGSIYTIDNNIPSYIKLVVYIHKNEPYLAYQFYIECLVPQRSLCAYADASTGFVLDIRSSVCESMASVTTVYSGLRNIETQKMRFYPKTYSPYYSINLTALDEQTYKISMIKDNLPSSKTLEGNITSPITEASDYPEWTLEAVNITTGMVVLSELLREPNYIVNAKRWNSGLYIIRAIINDQEIFNGKINVKE